MFEPRARVDVAADSMAATSDAPRTSRTCQVFLEGERRDRFIDSRYRDAVSTKPPLVCLRTMPGRHTDCPEDPMSTQRFTTTALLRLAVRTDVNGSIDYAQRVEARSVQLDDRPPNPGRRCRRTITFVPVSIGPQLCRRAVFHRRTRAVSTPRKHRPSTERADSDQPVGERYAHDGGAGGRARRRVKVGNGTVVHCSQLSSGFPKWP